MINGNELQQIIDRRNELFEMIMDMSSFMEIYNGDWEESEDEILSGMEALDDAIYDCRENGTTDDKLTGMKEIIKRIEEYL